jgi:hypothetical protein
VWLSAIAAAVTGLTGRPDIDLLPLAEKEHRERARIVRTSALGFALVAAAMFVATTSQLQRYRAATEHLLDGRARLDEMNELLVALREERSARHAARERARFLSHALAPRSAFEEILHDLSSTVESGAHVDRLDMQPVLDAPDDPYADGAASYSEVSGESGGDAAWPAESFSIVVNGAHAPERTVRIAGRVWGEDAAEAQQAFERFHGKLTANPRLRAASLDPITLQTDAETGRSVLSFVIIAPTRG